LAIHTAGAYCYAMGGVYNLRPMPSEVLVDKNDKLIRRRLSNKELVAQIIKECSL
jgi:diaminopimelate decarboxylase